MRRLLLVVLLAGFALRACHLGYGLDLHDLSRTILSNQQDEEGMARQVLSGASAGNYPWMPQSAGLLRGDPQPGVFLLWGSAGYWVFGAADAAVLWPMSWSHPGGWSGLLAELDGNPSLIHLLHRGVSLLAAMLALLSVWRMGRRILGERGGLLATTIAAAAYLPAREAHFGVLDSLAAMWIVLAVEQALALVEDPRPRRSVLAGLFTGLALATKYFGGVVALPVAVAHLAARGRLGTGRAAGRLVLAGGVAVVALLVTMPVILTDPQQLLGALRHQRDTIGINLVGQSGGVGYLAKQHFVHTFVAGFGETALAFAAVGGWLLWRRGGTARLAALAPLLLLPIFFVARSGAVRYGIAPLLLLSLPAAACCEAAGAAVARALRRPGAATAGIVLATALCIGPSLARTLAFDRALGGRDTRLDALDWLRELEAPRNEVFAFGFTGLPRPGLIAKWPLPYIDYLRVITGGLKFTREEGRRMRPRWLLRDETGASYDFAGWVDWARVAAHEYRIVRHVDPRPDPAACDLPDPVAGSPSFYLPFDNPWAMERPGPVLTLYERIDAGR